MITNISCHKIPDIMVVDDNPANLQLLGGMLKECGYKVRPMPDGARALQAAKNIPPDLILLDVNMPEMDGYEFCRRLKLEPEFREVPVIFISAMHEVVDKVKAFESGGIDYVNKPFNCEEVEARVRAHLVIRGLQRELKMHNEQLEQLIEERTRQLAEANERLALLDRTKSDFLSMLAHELRSPLNGLLGISEFIFEECSSNPKVRDFQRFFEESRHRIITLLDDALVLASIVVCGEQFGTAPCALDAVLAEALKKSGHLAVRRNVEFQLPDYPVSALVQGDAELLVKALAGLFETAVKFSGAGTPVRLTVEPGTEETAVNIQTAGQTIDPAMLSRFFDVLAIKDAIVPGGDLGLSPATAERVISFLGGAVTVENMEPPGILLRVKLKSPGDAPPQT